MSATDSLQEYSQIIDVDLEDRRKISIILNSVSFFTNEFPKLSGFAKFSIVDQSEWIEKFPDEDVDLTRLAGKRIIISCFC